MKSVKKKIYYREVQIADCKETLQSLLMKALDNTTAIERSEKINDSEEIFRLLNRYENYRGMLFCQMVLVEPGASQPIVIYKDNAREYYITGIHTDELPQKEYQRNSDFVNSMLYFGVKGNELIVMPSLALTFKTLENHLSWLLAVKEKLIPEGSSVALIRKAPQDVADLVSKHRVKRIEIGSSIISKQTKMETRDSDETIVESAHFSEPIGIQLLQSLMEKCGRDKVPEDIFDKSNLRAKIVLTYDRKTDDAGQNILNVIGSNLRNFDDDILVKLDGYGTLSNDQLNLYKEITLQKTDKGLYVIHDLYEQAIEWLISLYKTKEGVE